MLGGLPLDRKFLCLRDSFSAHAYFLIFFLEHLSKEEKTFGGTPGAAASSYL